MNYDQLVQRGRRAVEKGVDAKWELGDLALDVEPMGSGHGNTGSYAGLEKYAKDIGIEFETLNQYRKVAAAWPKEDGTRVPSASWTVHREMMSEPDRVKKLKGWTRSGKWFTLNEYRAKVGKKPTGNGLKSTQQKKEAVEELLNDPDVVKAVNIPKKAIQALPKAKKVDLLKAAAEDEDVVDAALTDDKTRANVQRSQQRRGKQESEERSDTMKPMKGMMTGGTVVKTLVSVEHRLDDAIREAHATKIHDTYKNQAIDRIKAIRGKLQMLDAVLKSEGTDKELEKMLGERS